MMIMTINPYRKDHISYVFFFFLNPNLYAARVLLGTEVDH